MSVAQLKIEQGFRKHPDTCGNCKHFTMERVAKSYERWGGRVDQWTEDKKLRCGLGGFKVGKTSVCDKHERVTA